MRENTAISKLCASVLLLICTCLCGIRDIYGQSSDRWKWVSVNEKEDVYYDAQTIQKLGSIVQVWSKFIFLNDKNSNYMLMLFEINCSARKFRIVSSINHRKDGSTENNSDANDWEPIPPEAIVERLYEIVCKDQRSSSGQRTQDIHKITTDYNSQQDMTATWLSSRTLVADMDKKIALNVGLFYGGRKATPPYTLVMSFRVLSRSGYFGSEITNLLVFADDRKFDLGKLSLDSSKPLAGQTVETISVWVKVNILKDITKAQKLRLILGPFNVNLDETTRKGLVSLLAYAIE
jgi:hypothetical protein